MTRSEQFRRNAENCAELADAAENLTDKARYKRMESAWISLAEVQAWLDGEAGPAQIRTH